MAVPRGYRHLAIVRPLPLCSIPAPLSAPVSSRPAYVRRGYGSRWRRFRAGGPGGPDSHLKRRSRPGWYQGAPIWSSAVRRLSASSQASLRAGENLRGTPSSAGVGAVGLRLIRGVGVCRGTPAGAGVGVSTVGLQSRCRVGVSGIYEGMIPVPRRGSAPAPPQGVSKRSVKGQWRLTSSCKAHCTATVYLRFWLRNGD